MFVEGRGGGGGRAGVYIVEGGGGGVYIVFVLSVCLSITFLVLLGKGEGGGIYFLHFKLNAGLGGSVGCAVQLETRRSRVQPPLRSTTFFHGD